MLANPLSADLDHVLAQTKDLWDELRGQRILITGGTGFFGCWLLESFAWANDRLGLGAEAVVLTRNPAAFQQKAPHLAERKDIRFLAGDVRDFPFPEGEFSHVIHAATETNAKLYDSDPATMADTIVAGTRRVLEFCRWSRARKLLLTSSGAVYGRQPAEVTHLGEDFAGAPEPLQPGSVYGEAKRVAEMLCVHQARQGVTEAKLARCFAFVGPYLPLDSHFAAGNFIRDAFRGGPIQVNGDGTPFRSYLYAADLAIWLWTILFHGQSARPYNVGSARDLTIAELAATVNRVFGEKLAVSIARMPVSGQPPQRYVPSVERAEKELGLREWINLEEGIRRTVLWHRERRV